MDARAGVSSATSRAKAPPPPPLCTDGHLLAAVLALHRPIIEGANTCMNSYVSRASIRDNGASFWITPNSSAHGLTDAFDRLAGVHKLECEAFNASAAWYVHHAHQYITSKDLLHGKCNLTLPLTRVRVSALVALQHANGAPMIWQIDNSEFYAPPRTYEGVQLIGLTAVKPAGQMARCAVGISNPKLLHRRSVTGGTIGGTGPSAIYLMRQPMSSQRLEIMRCATHLACDFLKEVENELSKLSDGFVNLSNPTHKLRKGKE